MDKSFEKIKIGIYPGDGVLDPRWEEFEYYSKRLDRMMTIWADVEFEKDEDGLKVLPGRGTSLHDVPKWFPNHDFWIPVGTEYSDELVIKRDEKKKSSPYNPKLVGHHYQIECKTRMTQIMMQGYLNNMARAAVELQCKLAKKG